MEGGATYGNEVLEKGPCCFPRAPPLTPLERFLSSSYDGELCFSSKPISKQENKVGILGDQNGFCGANLGAIGVPQSGFFLEESSLYDGFLLGGEASYYNGNESFVGGNVEEVVRGEKARQGKRVQSSSCSSSITTAAATTVVKGQWTAEEDSCLVRLVKQYGVRKWSQIAKKLVGRIGKQCRERWHNHLRPDIKKDTWTEEEERLLIEAHEKIGNKWAEIAKRIPGRTENSIKNHWNATKRRQNSKRKTKKKNGQGEKSHPSILQEYIRSKTSRDTCNTKTTPFTSQSNQFHIPLQPTLTYQYSSSTPTTTHMSTPPTTHMDDMFFTQNFFENSTAGEGRVHVGDITNPSILDSLDFSGFEDDDYRFMGMDYECTSLPSPTASDLYKEASAPTSGSDSNSTTTSTHLQSDLYLSYLLSGEPSPYIDAYDYPNTELLRDQVSSSCKRDMDLIEMISSSRF